MKTVNHRTYVAAALLATLCWGAGTTLTKLALSDFEPALLLVIQLLSSVAFLLCMAPILRVRLPTLRSLSKTWWLGTLEPGMAYFLALEGLRRVTAAEAVLLSSTESILVVLLAWRWARERPRGVVLLLALVGAVGVMLVAGSGVDMTGLAPSLLGDALLIGGVMCAAGYVVLSSRMASVTEPLSALIAQQAVAVVFAAAMCLIFSAHAPLLPAVPAMGWVLAVSSGIVQYACAFWLYLWALKGLSASVAGLYLSLIPVFGLVVAIPVLGDTLTAVQWMGAALIIGSVLVLTRVREEPHGEVAPVTHDAPVSML